MRKILPSLGLIALIIASRLMPHPANFAAVTGATLAGALYTRQKYSWLIPLAGMFISDIFIGFYNPWVMLSVYGSFMAIYLLGLILRKNKTALNSAAMVLTSSILFFIVTNGSVWLFGSLYPHTLAGASLAYTMAIPFFRSTLAGDLSYFALCAGAFEFALALKRQPSRVIARTPSVARGTRQSFLERHL